jgi:hypothetical protein
MPSPQRPIGLEGLGGKDSRELHEVDDLVLLGVMSGWWLLTTGCVMAMCRAAATGDYMLTGG